MSVDGDQSVSLTAFFFAYNQSQGGSEEGCSCFLKRGLASSAAPQSSVVVHAFPAVMHNLSYRMGTTV